MGVAKFCINLYSFCGILDIIKKITIEYIMLMRKHVMTLFCAIDIEKYLNINMGFGNFKVVFC